MGPRSVRERRKGRGRDEPEERREMGGRMGSSEQSSTMTAAFPSIAERRMEGVRFNIRGGILEGIEVMLRVGGAIASWSVSMAR